jgi:hypothetical protein
MFVLWLTVYQLEINETVVDKTQVTYTLILYTAVTNKFCLQLHFPGMIGSPKMIEHQVSFEKNMIQYKQSINILLSIGPPMHKSKNNS